MDLMQAYAVKKCDLTYVGLNLWPAWWRRLDPTPQQIMLVDSWTC
jgi:hypothetical protein